MGKEAGIEIRPSRDGDLELLNDGEFVDYIGSDAGVVAHTNHLVAHLIKHPNDRPAARRLAELDETLNIRS